MIASLFSKKSTPTTPQSNQQFSISNAEKSSAVIFCEDDDEDEPKSKYGEEQLDNNASKSLNIISIEPTLIKVKPKQKEATKNPEIPKQQVDGSLVKKKGKKRRKLQLRDISQQNNSQAFMCQQQNQSGNHQRMRAQKSKKKQTIETAHESNGTSKEIVEEEDQQNHQQENFRQLDKIVNHDPEPFYYYNSQKTQYDSFSEESVDQEEYEEKMNSHKIIKTFQADSLNDLLFSHLPSGCSVECLIFCRKPFLSTTRSYDLFLKKEKKYLITAIKNRIRMVSQFQLKQNPYKQSNKPVLGLLTSNFSGLQYTMKINTQKQIETLHISYSPNILGLSNRNIAVTQNSNSKKIAVPPIKPFSLIKNYLQGQKDPKKTSQFHRLWTKPPTQNKKGEYQIDLKGLANFPSSNNCVLEDKYGKSVIIMGKVQDQVFSFRVISSHTNLSIGQAFGIAVSNLDTKLFVR